MASIRQEIQVAAPAEKIWDAVRDVGEIHRRLVPGFVTDCKLDGDARIVTFGNGMVAREVIVDLDDAARRAVWSASGGRLTHHNASLQVFAEDAAHSRLVWIADLLPHEMKPAIAGMIAEGLKAMKRTLENPGI
ncbi:SRPBCC family protein [Variovorax ginsengisoli]|uniref:SRPBCC family protein n=1 Tax=Variovorax ginsengisoli TaxID=363844 RepID=A0ABT8SH72_9BURK|nr:SRPBCC family protein [Variovorax ginsengisoli]MDN8617686.1 SRPBCC family protein [Variovorax ginsengisoli]MDO1536856.1 SRPBCC family protein [Variovorax ginsengisoli]